MKAVEYFLNGNSCSESVVSYAIDRGYADKSLLSLATPFSGGIGSGCLCGAVSGAIMTIGSLYGKDNKYGNPPIARALAKTFMDRFKEVHKVTCCRVLSRGTEAGTPERKQHCSAFVEYSSKLLDEILSEAEVSVKNG